MENYKAPVALPKRKKRKRLSLTCTSCRERKIKCDQGRPCSSCVKKHIPSDLCIYNDSPFVAENPARSSNEPGSANVKVLKDEIQMLKSQIEEMKRRGSQSSSTSTANDGKDEPVLKLYDHLYSKPDKIVHYGATSWRTLIDKEDNYDNLISASKQYISNVKKKWKFEYDVNKMSSEDYKEINVQSPITLLENLANYLPPYDVVEGYIQNYLNGYWNRRTPIVDNEEILNSFDQLFTRSGGSLLIKVQNKAIDYAKIALILIIIKHSINTINATNSYLKGYDFNDHLLQYADKLLELSKYMKKPSVPALQALILIRQFKMINPIDGDGGDGNKGSLLFKTAINMAVMMGMHKDIDLTYCNFTQTTRATMKRIWKHLLFQDAVLSFHMGIPLSIDEHYVDPSSLVNNDMYGVLGYCLREAVRHLNARECRASDLLSIIHRITEYNNGELLTLSSVLMNMSVEKLLSDESFLIDVELKMFSIYVIHVLYDVLYHGAAIEDPDREIYYNGTMKFGCLTASHFIEAMVKFNKICVDAAKSSNIHLLVAMCQSIVGVSKIIFLKVFTCIYTFELVKLINAPSTDPKHPSFKQVFELNVTDIEKVKVDDQDDLLNTSFRSPAFLHGLVTMSCKYLLKLKNNSFGSVFSMNFCLFIVLALFKYFERFVDQRFTKQKEAIELAKAKTSVSYNTNTKGHTPFLTADDNSLYGPSENGTSLSNGSTDRLSDGGTVDANLSARAKDSFFDYPVATTMFSNPLSPIRSTGSNVSSLNNQLLPEYTAPTGETFDEVVQKILYSGDLDFFEVQYDPSFSDANVDDFLSGTGMFYNEETSKVTEKMSSTL